MAKACLFRQVALKGAALRFSELSFEAVGIVGSFPNW